VLAKYFNESFVREKRRINCLFGLILAMFILRTISSLFIFLMQTVLICSFQLRLVVQQYVRFFYIYTVILVMLIFQHRTFRRQEKKEKTYA